MLVQRTVNLINKMGKALYLLLGLTRRNNLPGFLVADIINNHG